MSLFFQTHPIVRDIGGLPLFCPSSIALSTNAVIVHPKPDGKTSKLQAGNMKV